MVFKKRFWGRQTPEGGQNQGQVPGFRHWPDGFSEAAFRRREENLKG